jgi:NifU-like protein involved in Fe-S cluster formation
MSKTDSDVGTGLVGAPACGDVMKLQIRVDPNNNTISDVKFKTFGCGSAIASSSYLTELVRGMTLEDAGKIRNTEIARELCLPPVKRELIFSPFGQLFCHCDLEEGGGGRSGWSRSTFHPGSSTHSGNVSSV